MSLRDRVPDPAVVLLAVAALGVVGYDAVRTWGQRLLDVEVYKQGAQLWLDGHDLYLTADLPIDLPFLYPPFAALVFSPLTSLDPVSSGVVITVLSLVALVTVAVLLAHRLPERFGPWPVTAALMVALTMQFEPVQHTFGFGQINIILLALVVADCLIDVRWWPRGALVGLAAAIKLTPLVFLLYFLLRRDVRAAVVAVASFAGCLAIGFIAAPKDSVAYWTGIVFETADRVGSDYAGNQSIYAVLARSGLSDTGVTILWVVACAVVLAAGGLVMWWAIRRGQHVAAVAVCGMLGVVISPVSWSHHWVWVIPVLAALLGFVSWRLLVPAVIGLGVFVVAPHWQVPANEGREANWTPAEWVLGNAYLLTALVALAAVVVVGAVHRPQPAAVPAGARPDPTRLTVDGEEFEVREDPDRSGQYHYDWISGPNDDYGFTSASSDGSPSTSARHVEAARDFLAQVDPKTGYIK